MPNRDALRTLREHVETALSSFSMRRQGAALTLPDVVRLPNTSPVRRQGVSRAVDVIPRTAYCLPRPRVARSARGPAWNGFGGDARNTRFAPAAASGCRRPPSLG